MLAFFGLTCDLFLHCHSPQVDSMQSQDLQELLLHHHMSSVVVLGGKELDFC